MRHLIATLIIVAPVLVGGPALAQSGPSVDQIIKSLTPTGDVTKAGTRGIRLSPPAETRGVTATTTPVATRLNASGKRAPSAEPAAPTINLTVNFTSGSADLTPQAIMVLDKLGAALASDGLLTYRFRIEGHTDTVGTRDFNNSLSGRRAEAVVTYIRDKYKVDPARLEAVGMGSQRPVVATADQVDEPRNRRVQVTNIGG